MPHHSKSVGIVTRSYNGRGLVTHRAETKALVTEKNGTLWAAVREGQILKYINIYRSIDNGFSWQRVYAGNFTSSSDRKTGLSGLNANGPHMYLQVFEHIDRLVLWHSYYSISENQYHVEPFVFQKSTMERIDDAGEIATNYRVPLNADDLTISATYNDSSSYLIYTHTSDLVAIVYKPTYQAAPYKSVVKTGDYFNIHTALAHRNGYVDIVILEDLITTYRLDFMRYNEASNTFSTPVGIHDPSDTVDIVDLSLARDGWGTLFLAWGETNHIGDDMDVKYRFSTDLGATWGGLNTLNKEPGHSVYTDAATGEKSTRTAVIGGIDGGFLLTYVHRNADGVAKTFVRKLSTDDGVTYELGDQTEVATHIALDSESVVGGRWFHPPASRLIDLDDPGQVRLGYQINEGNSTQQVDTLPVRFGQEPLSTHAYPNFPASLLGAYDVDIAQDIPSTLLAEFVIIGGPDENIDYHAIGFTGRVTERYIAAFNRGGTDYTVLQYEPRLSSELADRSGYETPIEHQVRCFLDSMSYEAPLSERGMEPFRSFIERDTRKLYLPPTTHISREFLVNRGNSLRRTVWTILFDGNEYEISQVVPMFLSDQLAYYSANAYVVGPSNDPWSKSVLPSET